MISHFIELGLAYMLAAMMPGPSTALIIKNGIIYSRLSSVQACLGTIVGTALQSGIIIIGLIFMDSDSIFLKIIQSICSIYLMYLGFKSLISRRSSLDQNKDNNLAANKSGFGYFLEGFLVEFLNPLAFGFFISIMTVIISPDESWTSKVAYWVEIILLCAVWFFTVAFVLSSSKITVYTRKFNTTIEKAAGVIFIIFGSRMFVL